MQFQVCGKTTFALQLADNVAKQGKKVIIFSLEQSKFELITKAISRTSYETTKGNARTHSAILKSTEIDETTTNALTKYMNEIAINEIIKEGTFTLSVDDIRDYLTNYVAETNERPLVVIDYLQILAPSNTKLSEKQQTDYNATTLKRISRNLDIPIIAISSFNRGSYNQSASFEAFKESGGIEYTADILLTMQLKYISEIEEENIYRREKDKVSINKETLSQEKRKIPRDIRLTCLKNRGGKSNFSVDYIFNPCFDYFEELPREKQAGL